MAMTIKFLRFPYLVQKAVINLMDLREVFALSTISRKSKKVAKQCLKGQHIYIRYAVNSHFMFQRDNGKGFVFNNPFFTFSMTNQDDQIMVFSYQLWKLLDQESVSMRMRNPGKSTQTTLQSFWENKEDSAEKMLRYFLDLFPNYSFSLYFEPNHTAEIFRRNMELIENVADLSTVGVSSSSINIPEFQPNDELCEAIMNASKRPRELYLSMETTDGYVYDPPANLLFNIEKVMIEKAKWVTRDIFIKLFLNCKQVLLENYNISDEDLAAIFEQWSLNSSMEYMVLNQTDGSNYDKTLNDVVAILPGAVLVQKAAIHVTGMRRVGPNQLTKVSFTEGRSYKIKGPDSKNYMIYYIYDYLYLTTKFEEIYTDDVLPNIESDEIWGP